MAFLDFILNLTGLLIWLSWCVRSFDPLAKSAPATLAGTVKRAEPGPAKRWFLLAGLAALLAVRALFYFQIAAAAGWTPKLDLRLVVLAFRGDKLDANLAYSFMSFCRVLMASYFWLLALVLINWREREPDAILKLLRLHLGNLCRLPWPVLALLPVVMVVLLWLGLHPALVRIGVVTPSAGIAALIKQGLLLALFLALTLKYLLAILLLTHLALSYVYLGNGPLWAFIQTSSRRILAPFALLGLRFGKVDLTPVVALVLIVVLLHWLPQWLEIKLPFVWPQ